MSAEFLSTAAADYQKIISGEFAETVTVKGSDIQGIFDETYEEIDPETGAVVMSRFPRIFLYLDDIPDNSITQGETLVIRGVTYKARTVELDGTGGVMVKLHGR